MKTILSVILLLFAVVSFDACRKKEACETNNTCTVQFTNVNSTNPYNIYINGTYQFQVNGNSGTNTATVTPGTLSLKAEQASGYLVTPTIYTANLAVAQCAKGTWSF